MKSNFTLQYLAKTLNIKFQHLFLLSKIKYVYGQAQAFHYGEFHFTYYVQMITWKMRNAYKILDGNPEDLGIDLKIILEWIFRK